MNAFVSGGAGFFGSHLVRRLLSEPLADSVVVYDNFTSGHRSSLEEVKSNPNLRIVEGDLKSLSDVESAMKGCDTVFHLAANPDISKAVFEPTIDFWEGTYLTQNVLEAMRLTGARSIYYTSGSGVYGENPEIPFAEDYGPCIPISTYGASKLASEALIASYCHMFGITARVFRFANVVGPRQTHGVGYDFVRRLKADPSCLKILGDGSQSKSYIHIEDVLSAVFINLDRGGPAYDLFNVASEDYISVREIAALAVEVAGLDADSVNLLYAGGDRGWKGDVPVIRFNCSKIKALGWHCSMNSTEAMRRSMTSMWKELSDGK